MPESNKTERQTKAGLLEKNGEKETDQASQESSEEKAVNTPKIPKETAEIPQKDKPLH